MSTPAQAEDERRKAEFLANICPPTLAGRPPPELLAKLRSGAPTGPGVPPEEGGGLDDTDPRASFQQGRLNVWAMADIFDSAPRDYLLTH